MTGTLAEANAAMIPNRSENVIGSLKKIICTAHDLRPFK